MINLEKEVTFGDHYVCEARSVPKASSSSLNSEVALFYQKLLIISNI